MSKDAVHRIAVIGAGAWGTALGAVFARAGRDVTLYARDPGLAAKIAAGANDVYLPGVALPEGLKATADLSQAVAGADLVVLSTPAQFLRGLLKDLAPRLAPGVPLINTAKGIEASTGRLMSEIAAEETPAHPYAVLSGPTFAHEVAAGLPAAATLAVAEGEDRGMAWAAALRGASFRPYLSADRIGVEVSGALKNVIAIACGIVEGRALGQNARAAVMARGMAEIRRLGLARGASVETFLGLSGLGDLTLTCNSMSSRNFSLGAEIGKGRALADILAGRKAVSEGVATARAAARLADETGVDMPICEAVDAILHGGGDVGAIITGLLSRDLKSEEA